MLLGKLRFYKITIFSFMFISPLTPSAFIPTTQEPSIGRDISRGIKSPQKLGRDGSRLSWDEKISLISTKCQDWGAQSQYANFQVKLGRVEEGRDLLDFP